jgi:hypothetical protein
MRRLGSPVHVADNDVWAWYEADGTVRGQLPDPDARGSGARWFTMPGAPAGWLAQACRFAGRELSPAEWALYVGDRPYQPVCPGAPRN